VRPDTADRRERRWTSAPVELRGRPGGRPRIGGYAAKFGKYSHDLGGFVEVLDPVVFNGSRGRDWPGVMARYNHDDNMLLGTTAAGTLTLALDAVGLDYDVDPPQHRSDVVELVQRGDVRGSSFAFRLPSGGGDEWGLSEQGYPMRRLVQAILVDVAPVNMPAYADTTVALRSLAVAKDVPFDEVEELREAGELLRLFRRTDRPYVRRTRPTLQPPAPVTISGADALLMLQGRRLDPDPREVAA